MALWTPEERNALLRELFELESRHGLLARDGHSPSEASRARYAELTEAYREGLPRAAVSRCPFCGSLVGRALDALGLDGLWWRYDASVRPFEGEPCPHYFALAGALRIDRERLENAPVLAVPGPEAPFVVPRMLAHEGISAVIASVPVGPHTGYAITYFADPMPRDLQRINTWGMDSYSVPSPEGGLAWDEVTPDVAEYDFELAPWVGRGKLMWVLPDDPKLILHGGVADCPYLGLPGRREIMRVQDGRAWSRAEELD